MSGRQRTRSLQNPRAFFRECERMFLNCPARADEVVVEPRLAIFINAVNGDDRVLLKDSLDGIRRVAGVLDALANLVLPHFEISRGNAEKANAVTNSEC